MWFLSDKLKMYTELEDKILRTCHTIAYLMNLLSLIVLIKFFL